MDTTALRFLKTARENESFSLLSISIHKPAGRLEEPVSDLLQHRFNCWRSLTLATAA